MNDTPGPQPSGLEPQAPSAMSLQSPHDLFAELAELAADVTLDRAIKETGVESPTVSIPDSAKEIARVIVKGANLMVEGAFEAGAEAIASACFSCLVLGHFADQETGGAFSKEMEVIFESAEEEETEQGA